MTPDELYALMERVERDASPPPLNPSNDVRVAMATARLNMERANRAAEADEEGN